MVPGNWGNRTFSLPPTHGVPALPAGIFPLARQDGRHVAGAEAKGGVATYWDLHAFVWYVGGGWLTLNRGRRLRTRSHHGVEDGRKKQG